MFSITFLFSAMRILMFAVVPCFPSEWTHQAPVVLLILCTVTPGSLAACSVLVNSDEHVKSGQQ